MQTTVELYRGKQGRKSLARALRGMVLIHGSKELATDIAAKAEVLLIEEGSTLIEEGNQDHDMYFVLSGRLQVCIKNREFALLGPGAHVGEFAVIDPRATRSATVRALQDTVTARLSKSDFTEIAEQHQDLWKNVSQVLSSHLREGNQFVQRPNARPHLLICASQIGWPFAQAIKTHSLDTENQVSNWVVETRCPEEDESIEQLEAAVAAADLAVIVIAPGDLELRDGVQSVAGRDSLLLQCGIALGALGRSRIVIVEPNDLEDASPSTQLDLIPLTYRIEPYTDLKTDMEAICANLRTTIQELGSR